MTEDKQNRRAAIIHKDIERNNSKNTIIMGNQQAAAQKQKPLGIIIAALVVVVLVIGYFVYDHFRPRCDSIFEQTTTKVGGNLDIIKSKGELFVGREKVQELAEGSQKVALHLKTCCVAQQSGVMTPEQFQGCINGAKEYENKIQEVSSIIGEAQTAKDQGNQQLVEQKAVQAREVASTTNDTVSQLSKVAATLAIPAKSGGPPVEKHNLNVNDYAGTAVTISVNGAWVGQWDTNSGMIPLESVVHGKNELSVELQGQPQNTVTVELWAQRTEGSVNLLRLNFQGKAAGKYIYSFVAK